MFIFAWIDILFIIKTMRIFLNEFSLSASSVLDSGTEGKIYDKGNFIIKKITREGRGGKYNSDDELKRIYSLHKKLELLKHPNLCKIFAVKLIKTQKERITAVEILKEKLIPLSGDEIDYLEDFAILLFNFNVKHNFSLLHDPEILKKIKNRIDNIGDDYIKRNLLGLLDASVFLLKNGIHELFFTNDYGEKVYDFNKNNVMKDENATWKIVDF